jgi:hypothetical protein
LRHIHRFDDRPLKEALLLGGGDYQEVPDAESMTKGTTLMAEPLTPLDIKVLLDSITQTGSPVVDIRLLHKKNRADKVYPSLYYHATGFMVTIPLSKLIDVTRFISYGGQLLGQDDIGWATSVAKNKEVICAKVHGWVGGGLWLNVTKDEEEWFHVRARGSWDRYFRCDQHAGLRSLITDLPVLFSHEK